MQICHSAELPLAPMPDDHNLIPYLKTSKMSNWKEERTVSGASNESLDGIS